MTAAQLTSTILTVIALCAGQILFKLAATDIDFSTTGLFKSLFNLKLIFALAVYAVATIMWLYVLKSTPLRLAYPFTAMAFFIVPIAAHFLLGETWGWNTVVGAALIAIGVCVSVVK